MPPTHPPTPSTHTGRCADLEAQAADAQAAADKLQRDLQDLSGAYATLEAHAAELERGGGGVGGEAAAAGERRRKKERGERGCGRRPRSTSPHHSPLPKKHSPSAAAAASRHRRPGRSGHRVPHRGRRVGSPAGGGRQLERPADLSGPGKNREKREEGGARVLDPPLLPSFCLTTTTTSRRPHTHHRRSARWRPCGPSWWRWAWMRTA